MRQKPKITAINSTTTPTTTPITIGTIGALVSLVTVPELPADVIIGVESAVPVVAVVVAVVDDDALATLTNTA
jgi:hypothetical protein